MWLCLSILIRYASFFDYFKATQYAALKILSILDDITKQKLKFSIGIIESVIPLCPWQPLAVQAADKMTLFMTSRYNLSYWATISTIVKLQVLVKNELVHRPPFPKTEIMLLLNTKMPHTNTQRAILETYGYLKNTLLAWTCPHNSI